MDWCVDAGMEGFVCCSQSYNTLLAPDLLIPLVEIMPPDMSHRQHRSHGGLDHQRMVDVLSNIALAVPMQPIQLRHFEERAAFKYQVQDGAHRFYASPTPL
jgi:hypothetical protein